MSWTTKALTSIHGDSKFTNRLPNTNKFTSVKLRPLLNCSRNARGI